MKFRDLFGSRQSVAPVQHNIPSAANSYKSNYIFDFKIDLHTQTKILRTINDNISKDVTAFGSSEMNRSMKVDIPRMNYYINNQKISVPGSETQSISHYNNIVMRPENSWIKEHIGSLSSFLHQGIFVDFFDAVDSWTAKNGEKWNIRMITLDRDKTETDFYISNSGAVKMFCQANVKNVLLKNNSFVLADSEQSFFSLQLSFCIIRNPERLLVVPLTQEIDHCSLKIKGNGVM